MTTFIPKIGVLPPQQQAMLPLLRPVLDLGFVLYGGTAVALRLGHRQSIDFDFFIEQPLDVEAIFEAVPFLRDATVIQQEPTALTVLASATGFPGKAVKFSFFGPIRTGRVGTPQLTSDGILCVASMDDLFATKLKVILQRVEVKDYRDIAAMIAYGLDLETGLGGARALFGPSLQPSETLKAMTYFEGGDLHRLSSSDRAVLVNAVKAVRQIPFVETIDRRLAVGMEGS